VIGHKTAHTSQINLTPSYDSQHHAHQMWVEIQGAIQYSTC